MVKRLRQGLATVAVLAVTGCMPLSPAPTVEFLASRAPTPADAPSGARYLDRLQALIAGFEVQRLRRAGGRGPNDTRPVEGRGSTLRDQLALARAAAAPLDGGRIAAADSAAPRGAQRFSGRWRAAHAHLYLDRDGPAPQAPPFRFSGLQAYETTVFLHNIARTDLEIEARCDGPVRLLHADTGRYSHDAGARFGFHLPRRQDGRTRLVIPPGTDRCALTIRAAGQPGRVQLLEREETVSAELAAHDTRYDLCAVPATRDPLEQVFFADRWLSQTCVVPQGRTTLLSEGRDAFNAKVEALTGTRLPEAAFDAGNPFMPLDFSNAPALDLIYVSYLHVRADFSGQVLVRMLRHHAARGATIRILVTDSLMLRRDRALVESLAADFPNVQIQNFRWEPPGFGALGEAVDSIHRTNHVKLFTTLSPEPGRSRAHVGGRNIHDGFVFAEPRDLSAWPQLHDYDPDGPRTLAFFASYRDLEIEVTSDDSVRAISAHMASIWHRDHETNIHRPFSLGVRGEAPRSGMRHFLSAPYADAQALERYYVELFDAARERIVLVTPYLNPPAALEAAMNRARDRGVEITIVARIEVFDPAGTFITPLNRRFVERYADRIAIWEHDPDLPMLHSKLVIVDSRLAIVTSTNFNQRSFLHDSENGIVALDTDLVGRLEAQIDAFLARSRRLDTEVDIPPLFRPLFALPALLERF